MPSQPEERFQPEDWLHLAEGDLIAASCTGALEFHLEVLCFHSQQCVEKCLKAVLYAAGLDFPFTHNIGLLLRIAADGGIEVPPALNKAADITKFAVESRYPHRAGPTKDDSTAAFELANIAMEWAVGFVAKQRNADSKSDAPTA